MQRQNTQDKLTVNTTQADTSALSEVCKADLKAAGPEENDILLMICFLNVKRIMFTVTTMHFRLILNLRYDKCLES